MAIDWKEVSNLYDIVNAATTQCKEDAQFNLLLAYELPVNVLGSSFIEAYRDDAMKWIAEEVPKDFYFTHGQYFKGKRGFQHVIDELKAKRTSRRALLSLIGMEEIIGSEDKAIPAFLILQFGIDRDFLMVTAYFRALEVSKHLRINLTEICLHCGTILSHFSDIKKIRLLLLAFKAYCDEKYNCLKKPDLDQQMGSTIGIAVHSQDIQRIRVWLESKKVGETQILVNGLQELVHAVQLTQDKYPPAFLSNITLALAHLERLKELREKHSEGQILEEEMKKYLEKLDDAVQALS